MAGYLKHLQKRWLPRFHRDLFAWHCRKFFPFDRYLLACDHGYLERCFQLAEDYLETTSTSRHYSYYCYSHRVKGVDVNSSRLMFGSIMHPEAAWQAAQPSIQARKIQLPAAISESEAVVFYGLGWDILAGHFKIYFRFLDREQIPLSAVQRMCSEVRVPCAKEGIISFTYRQNGDCEEKVYLFPLLQEPSMTPVVGARVLMLSSQHGMMSQYDMLELQEWLPLLNPQGQRIVQLYRTYGEVLRTIHVKNPNHFTIYFP